MLITNERKLLRLCNDEPYGFFKYDEPWWDMAAAFPDGPDNLWHATLEVFGIAERWRQSPYTSATDTDLDRLRAFYQELGLL